MNLLLDHIVKHALLLVSTTSKAPSDSTFIPWLLEHTHLFSEQRWMEAFSTTATFPTFFPPGNPAALTPESRSQFWNDAGLRHGIILLAGPPHPIIGIIDPFTINESLSIVSAQFAHLPEVRLITPHFLNRSLSVHSSAPQHNVHAITEDLLKANCEGIGSAIPNQSFPDDLASAQYRQLWGLDWLPTGYLDLTSTARLDPDFHDVIHLVTTSTVAWLASPRAHENALQEELNRRLGLRIVWSHLSSHDLHSFHSTRTEPDPTNTTTTSATPPPSIRIEKWPVASNQPVEAVAAHLYAYILHTAISLNASDIHFEPSETNVAVRFRIHGKLVSQPALPHDLYAAVLRRIKIQASMLHSETGIPQDGSATFLHESNHATTPFDLRVSVGVVRSGHDNCVIRILSREIRELDELHLPPSTRTALNSFLASESGLMLIAGPTGSGKTTALYACLNAINIPERKIITIENPVEKLLPRATQFDLRDKSQGMTFLNAMRTAMRQDPDVILVGEIRDQDSANLAVQASLSGHLVLSSVHAPDSVAVLDRLNLSFNVDPASLAAALRLIVSIRLVRRLCPNCKQIRPARAYELKSLPETDVAQPVVAHAPGCAFCAGSGTSGRFALTELLEINDPLRALLNRRASVTDIRTHLYSTGFVPLATSAARAALTGDISLEEALRFPVYRGI